MTWTDRVRALRMDVTPLRESRDFRLLFTAGSVFYLGSMVAYVAVPFADLRPHRLQLPRRAGRAGRARTRSSSSACTAARSPTTSTAAGSSSAPVVAQVVLMGAFAWNAFSAHPRVWVIFVLAGALRRHQLARSVPRARRWSRAPSGTTRSPPPTPSAASRCSSACLLGPLIGGLLVAYVGVGWCFLAGMAGYAIASPCCSPPCAPTRTTARRRHRACVASTRA